MYSLGNCKSSRTYEGSNRIASMTASLLQAYFPHGKVVMTTCEFCSEATMH